MTQKPNERARNATAVPMRPRPIIPRTLPRIRIDPLSKSRKCSTLPI